MDKWKPGASIGALKRRAQMMASIRHFFSRRSVLEVDVPLLSSSTVTDINIESISAKVCGSKGYLQTSPEYFMKRLLASGSGDIYSMSKAFRDGEVGSKHNPEFTMLEWYRCGWDEHQLIDEVIDLISSVISAPENVTIDITKISYIDCFVHHLGFDPQDADLDRLQEIAAGLASESWSEETRENCLDLIFSLKVEPQLPLGIAIIYDYPECQSALAQFGVNNAGQKVSRRFEVFLNRMEVGNGYLELTDADEQRSRFNRDCINREKSKKSPVNIDIKLLAALEAGLPSCAGVAIGVDRLLMSEAESNSIDEVVSFSWLRC